MPGYGKQKQNLMTTTSNKILHNLCKEASPVLTTYEYRMPEFVYERISPINLVIYVFTGLSEQQEIYKKLTSDKG